MDRFRLVTTFMSVADAENFSRAAQSLHLSPQAVSLQISQLEAWLGVRLFHRTTRLTRLTADGETYLAACMHAMEEVKGRGIPEWLSLQADPYPGRVLSLPSRAQINLLASAQAGK